MKEHILESNTKLMKTTVQNDDSNDSSDDDFLVHATKHMRIKKADRVTKDDTNLSGYVKSLEVRIRRFEKNFNEAKDNQYSDSQVTKFKISAFAGFDREPEIHKANKQQKSIEKNSLQSRISRRYRYIPETSINSRELPVSGSGS